MTEPVIIALISAIAAGLPTLATVITAIMQSRTASRHAAKQSILQMILEDHVATHERRLPENYQNILNEYDVYSKNGGNSYIHEKVEDYKKWYAKWQAEHIDKKGRV